MPYEKSSNMRQEILNYINNTIAQIGRSPSFREIQNKFLLASPSHVDHHLRMLEKAGLITIIPKEPYGIRPMKNNAIPVKGHIAAGEPLEIFTKPNEWIDLGPELRGDNLYALKVKGRSMIEDGIYDGDYAIIREQKTCELGEIIVAVHKTTPAPATLKRFMLGKDCVRLQPSNSTDDAINPIYIPNTEWGEEWEIQGIVIAIHRRCWKPKSNFR